jgi:uncharacterized protein
MLTKRATRRLNRRQRKKLHLGEFQEMGFPLHWEFRETLDEKARDQFFDSFVSMLESRGLCCAGGFSAEGCDLFVARLGRGTVSPEDQGAIVDWLQGVQLVVSVCAGALVDTWHGDS